MPNVADQSAAMTSLVGWLLQSIQPPAGWRYIEAEFKPVSDQIYVLMRVDDGNSAQEAGGSVKPDSEIYDEVLRLQEATAQEGTGTWLTALVRAEPTGPDGEVDGKAAFNFDHDRGAIVGEDGEYTAEQLVEHLTRYPRRRDVVPEWIVQRVEAAGLQLPTA